jgi:dolichyl-phosphate beta-glucosyltransferase
MSKFRPLLELMTIDRFGFDVEFLYVAYHKGLRLKEIPVKWNDVEGSKISFRTGLDGFREVYQISRNARRGVYDMKK